MTDSTFFRVSCLVLMPLAVVSGALTVIRSWRMIGVPFYSDGWGGSRYGLGIENFSFYYGFAESLLILLLPLAGLAYLIRDRLPIIRSMMRYALGLSIIGLMGCILTLIYIAVSDVEFYWGYGDMVGNSTGYIARFIVDAIYPVSLGLFMILLLQGTLKKEPAQ